MKFYGQISVARYAEDNWNPETTGIYADHFQEESIQSAKAHLIEIANETELFSWIRSGDNDKHICTGEDLHWRDWCAEILYKQNAYSREFAYSAKKSERASGETVYPKDAGKFGKSVEYQCAIRLQWRPQSAKKVSNVVRLTILDVKMQVDSIPRTSWEIYHEICNHFKAQRYLRNFTHSQVKRILSDFVYDGDIQSLFTTRSDGEKDTVYWR